MGEGSSGSFIVLEQLPRGELFYSWRAGGAQSTTGDRHQEGATLLGQPQPRCGGSGKQYSWWTGWDIGAGLRSTLVPQHGAARGRYLKHGNYFLLNITMLFRLCPPLSPGTVCEEEMPRLGAGEAAAPSCVCGLA